MSELQRVLRVDVVDATGEQLNGARIDFFEHETRKLISTAQPIAGAVTFQSTGPLALHIVGRFGPYTATRDVAADALSVTLEFPQVRLVRASERWAALAIGVAFIVVILALLTILPEPKGLTALAYRAVLALGVGLVFSSVTGFLKLDLTLGKSVAVTAGGSAAAFALLYLVNPPPV